MEQTEILTEKQCFSRIGASYFTMAVLTFVLQIAVTGIAVALFGKELVGGMMWLVSLAPMYLIAVPVCVLMMRRVPAARPKQYAMGAGAFFKWLLISYGVMYAGSIAGQIVTHAISAVRGSGELTDDVAELIQNSSMLVNLLTTVLLAPPIEEFLFRKLLIDRVGQFGDKLAVVLSGLMFGLFHGNFSQFFYAAGVGMVFAYVYIRTGRLRYSIAMHMTLNFLGAIIAPAILNICIAMMDMDAMTQTVSREMIAQALLVCLYAVLLLVCTITGIVLLVKNHRRLVLHPGICPLPRGRRLRTVIGNGGMLAFLIGCALLFAVSIGM